MRKRNAGRTRTASSWPSTAIAYTAVAVTANGMNARRRNPMPMTPKAASAMTSLRMAPWGFAFANSNKAGDIASIAHAGWRVVITNSA
jgi:hypothetical protein